MFHSWCFKCKNLRRVPKRIIVIWIVLLLFVFYCLGLLFIPKYQKLNNISECQITIERIYLHDTHDSNGSRFRLYIYADNQTYYLDYPQSHSKAYLAEVEKDLLSGKITTVNAQYISHATIRDSILGRKRIVDLRADSAVYYDLDMEKQQLRENKISSYVLFILSILIWVIYSLFIVGIYGLIGRSQRHDNLLKERKK